MISPAPGNAMREKVECLSADALALAELASLAVRAESLLLRTLRERLLQWVPAEAEADLWFSSIVSSRTPQGIVFVPEAAEVLRARLRQSGRLEEAWKVVLEVHANASSVQRLEEEIAYVATSRPGDGVAIDKLLMSIVRAVIEQPKGVDRWSQGAFNRLPSAARPVASTTLLGLALKKSVGTEAADILFQQPAQALAGEPTRTVSVLRRGDELIFNATEPEAAAISVPVTEPARIKVESPSFHLQTITLTSHHTNRVFVGDGEATVSVIGGRQYRIPPDRQPYVFVSAALDGNETARSVRALLADRGIASFHTDDLEPGSSWREAIERALEDATALVLVYSGANQSEFVATEVARARGRGIPVAVVNEGSKSPRSHEFEAEVQSPRTSTFSIDGLDLDALLRALGIAPNRVSTPSASDIGLGFALKIEAHDHPVTATAIHVDTNTVLTASNDCTIAGWDLGTGAPRLNIQTDAPASALAVSPKGDMLAAGFEDGGIVVWDLQSHRVLHRLSLAPVIPPATENVARRRIVVVFDEWTDALERLRVEGSQAELDCAFVPSFGSTQSWTGPLNFKPDADVMVLAMQRFPHDAGPALTGAANLLSQVQAYLARPFLKPPLLALWGLNPSGELSQNRPLQSLDLGTLSNELEVVIGPSPMTISSSAPFRAGLARYVLNKAFLRNPFVESLDWSHDGRYLLAAGGEGLVVRWDLETERADVVDVAPGTVARRARFYLSPHLVSYSQGRDLLMRCLWDNGEPQRLDLATSEITALDVHESGCLFWGSLDGQAAVLGNPLQHSRLAAGAVVGIAATERGLVTVHSGGTTLLFSKVFDGFADEPEVQSLYERTEEIMLDGTPTSVASNQGSIVLGCVEGRVLLSQLKGGVP